MASRLLVRVFVLILISVKQHAIPSCVQVEVPAGTILIRNLNKEARLPAQEIKKELLLDTLFLGANNLTA